MSDIVQKIYDGIQNLGIICEVHMGMDVWKEIITCDQKIKTSGEVLVVSYSKASDFEKTKIVGNFCNMDVIIVDYFPPNTYFFVPRKIGLLGVGSPPFQPSGELSALRIFDSIEEYETLEVLQA